MARPGNTLAVSRGGIGRGVARLDHDDRTVDRINVGVAGAQAVDRCRGEAITVTGSATRTKSAPKKLQINARKVLPSLWRADIVARFAELNPGNNSMTRFTKIALTIALAAAMTTAAKAQISYTGGTYTQDFDSMGATGTTTPTGWFAGTGTGGAVLTTTVVAGTGSLGTGANYNFGVAGVNAVGERALGSLASASTQRDTEIHFTNNLGIDITQFTISYDGEQWRNGGSTVPNVLTLQLSLDGTTWVSLGAAFNFTSPINTSTAGALDGNASANRVAGIGGTFNPSTPILNGSVFYLRWADPDDTGADSGMAIDNFSFSAVPEPSVYMLLGVGILLCGQRFLRPRKSA